MHTYISHITLLAVLTVADSDKCNGVRKERHQAEVCKRDTLSR